MYPYTTLKVSVYVFNNSVRQTDSALSNLSLNIHGHVEVPKSKKKIEKKYVRQL